MKKRLRNWSVNLSADERRIVCELQLWLLNNLSTPRTISMASTVMVAVRVAQKALRQETVDVDEEVLGAMAKPGPIPDPSKTHQAPHNIHQRAVAMGWRRENRIIRLSVELGVDPIASLSCDTRAYIGVGAFRNPVTVGGVDVRPPEWTLKMLLKEKEERDGEEKDPEEETSA